MQHDQKYQRCLRESLICLLSESQFAELFAKALPGKSLSEVVTSPATHTTKVNDALDWLESEGPEKWDAFVEALKLTGPDPLLTAIANVVLGHPPKNIAFIGMHFKKVNRETEFGKITSALQDYATRAIQLYGEEGLGLSHALRYIRFTFEDTERRLTNRFNRCVHVDTSANMGLPQFYSSLFSNLDEKSALNCPESEWPNLAVDFLAKAKTLLLLDLKNATNLVRSEVVQLIQTISSGSCVVFSGMNDADGLNATRVIFEPLSEHHSLELARYLSQNAGFDEMDVVESELMRLAQASRGVPSRLQAAIGLMREGSRCDEAINTITSPRPNNMILEELNKDDWATIAVLCLTSTATVEMLGYLTGMSPSDALRCGKRLSRRMLVELDATNGLQLTGENYEHLRKAIANKGKHQLSALECRYCDWAITLIRQNSNWETEPHQTKVVFDNLDNLLSALRLAVQLTMDRRKVRSRILRAIKKLCSKIPTIAFGGMRNNRDISEVDLFSLIENVAHATHLAGMWDKSVGILREAQVVIRDKLQAFECKLLLGRHYAHRGKTKIAVEEYLRPSLEFARATNNESLERRVELRLGHALHREEPQKSIVHLESAVNAARKAQDTETEIIGIGYLCDAYLSEYRFHETESLLNRSSEILKMRPWPRVEAHHERLRGMLNQLLGDPNTANSCFQKSSDLLKEFNFDRRLEGWLNLGLAETSCSSEQSLKHAKAAESIFESLKYEAESRRAKELIKHHERINNRDKAKIRCVLVCGAPASGKSTVRSWLVNEVQKWLSNQHVWSWGIDDSLRTLYPQVENPEDYRYDENGALVLKRRERQTRQAMAHLSTECSKRNEPCLIVEFAFDDWLSAANILNRSLLSVAVVLFVRSLLPLRLSRNTNRGGSQQIPQEVVESYPAELNDATIEFLTANGANLHEVNNEGTQQELFERIQRVFDIGDFCSRLRESMP